MKVVTQRINFDLEQVVREEVPYLSAFYRDGNELNRDIRDLLSFPVANKAAMPFYTLNDETTYKLNTQFEDYYSMMDYALAMAFHDKDLLKKFFDCHFLREHGKRFIPYAEATFHKKHPSVYGRFDAVFNPETEEVEGVYEFNGDTPVMLFESVNLQARFARDLGTDQYNNYWEIFMHEMQYDYRNIGVVCSTDFVEDMATCETLSQAFQEAMPHASVKFLDINELDFDKASRSHPYFAKGDNVPLDAVYILSPWEEMVSNFPEMLDDWKSWIDNIHVFEPAWRWFFSNKGMMALCTHLMETSHSFRQKFGHVKLIPTYLKHPQGAIGNHWVEKPVVGRLSNNIKIWNRGNLESDTGGHYDGENTVYQQYKPPYKVGGRNNFIMGFWMMGKHSASVCFREFDKEVLTTANERWIPHVVI